MEVSRRNEFELAGRSTLQDGKQRAKPQMETLTIESAVADFLEFTKNKKRPHTYKRHRAVMEHFRAFCKTLHTGR